MFGSSTRMSPKDQANYCLVLWGLTFGAVGIALIITNYTQQISNQECIIDELNFEYYNCSDNNSTTICTDCVIHYQYNNNYDSVMYHCGPNAKCVEKWVVFAQTKQHMCYKMGNKIHWGYYKNDNASFTYAAVVFLILSLILIIWGIYGCCRKEPMERRGLLYSEV